MDILWVAPQNLVALQEDEQSLCALQEDVQSDSWEVGQKSLNRCLGALGEVGQNSLNRYLGALGEVGTKFAYYVVGSNSS